MAAGGPNGALSDLDTTSSKKLPLR